GNARRAVEAARFREIGAGGSKAGASCAFSRHNGQMNTAFSRSLDREGARVAASCTARSRNVPVLRPSPQGSPMFSHNKRLQYSVHVSECNPALANLMLEQFGGPQGELAAAMRYFTQALAEDDPGRKDMLLD